MNRCWRPYATRLPSRQPRCQFTGCGAEVNFREGLLRIGDIDFVTVNGEVYSKIAMKLKDQTPARKTIMVTLANGGANSVYLLRRRVQPSHVPRDRIAPQARVRRRKDHQHGPEPDAQVRRIGI